jgi:hypothetical protein
MGGLPHKSAMKLLCYNRVRQRFQEVDNSNVDFQLILFVR